MKNEKNRLKAIGRRLKREEMENEERVTRAEYLEKERRGRSFGALSTVHSPPCWALRVLAVQSDVARQIARFSILHSGRYRHIRE